jgi:hypothetical protein
MAYPITGGTVVSQRCACRVAVARVQAACFGGSSAIAALKLKRTATTKDAARFSRAGACSRRGGIDPGNPADIPTIYFR